MKAKALFVLAACALTGIARTADKLPVRIDRQSVEITQDGPDARAVVTLVNDLDDGAECILATYWLSSSGDTLAVKHSYTHVPAHGTWTFDMSVPGAADAASVALDLRGDGFVNQTLDSYCLELQ